MSSIIPTINTAGAPPERHASRVVAEMVHWLYREERRLDDVICNQIKAIHGRLGTPKAQQKFVDRMHEACGSKGIVDLHLTPGKRGKFTIAWATWPRRAADHGGRAR